MADAAAKFETHRSALLALAYRMLGDFGRAEDLVQDAWLRWRQASDTVESPRAYLVKVVTRLCLNELSSARAQREETRGDRLPEPVCLDEVGLGRVEMLDQISMAFLVLLQRLTPSERATLLLHDVFDFDHGEIARLLAKSEPACRQLLKRARAHVETERRALSVSRDEHRRLLGAFVAAATTGNVDSLKAVLADEVVLIADAGPHGGYFGRVRNLPGPLVGKEKVAAFVAAVTPQGAEDLGSHERELNGQPALLVTRNGEPFAAISVSVADGLIRCLFMQADVGRLRHVTTKAAPYRPPSTA